MHPFVLTTPCAFSYHPYISVCLDNIFSLCIEIRCKIKHIAKTAPSISNRSDTANHTQSHCHKPVIHNLFRTLRNIEQSKILTPPSSKKCSAGLPSCRLTSQSPGTIFPHALPVHRHCLRINLHHNIRNAAKYFTTLPHREAHLP